MMTLLPLRPYQQAALDKLAHRQLTVLPTGTGKTRIMAEVCAAAGGDVVILCHREELLDQTARACRQVAPSRKVGVVQGPRKEWAATTIAMQQTVRNKIDAISRLPLKALLVDEAHRYTTEKSGHALLQAFEDAGATIYGFTATPQIHGKPIFGPGRPFVGISYRRSPIAMIREGYLCDVRALTVKWGDLDLSKVRVSKGDYTAASLGSALSRVRAPERIVEAWQEHAKDRARTIVFVPTVELGRLVTAAYRKAGVEATEVYGSTPAAERAKSIARVRAGEVRVLVNVLVGAEGFDVPEIDCVVQARPTRSWTLYVQSVGRGLRVAPGKADLLVLDIAGSSEEHDLATLPKALEIGFPLRGKSVREAAEERTPRELELEYGAAVLRETLLYTPVRWTAWGEEYVATFDPEHVVVIAPLEVEESAETSHSYVVVQTNVRSGVERTIGIFDYPADAQEAAEEHVRSEGDARLYKRSAAWRTLAPTDAQRRWFRGDVPATRGEASEAITLALYRKVRGRAS